MMSLSFSDTESSEESESEQQSQESVSDEDADDYRSYLRGDDMNKYDNEHVKFRAAERAMQKHQHEKVTMVSTLSSCLIII